MSVTNDSAPSYIHADQPELAGKLTGMLLELDESEVRKTPS
jgi:hypothetical protein